jgi:hypothetical protein
VTDFMFDDGWKAVAVDELSAPEPTEDFGLVD